jgi:hypothetical protein
LELFTGIKAFQRGNNFGKLVSRGYMGDDLTTKKVEICYSEENSEYLGYAQERRERKKLRRWFAKS